MIESERETLWGRLCAAGLAEGAVPAPGEAPTPWAVRLMLGFAGWLGAMFLLGFIGAAFAFVFRDEGAALPLGLVCCGAAYAIFRAVPRNAFVAQFGFAVSLAGQALVAFGLLQALGWRHHIQFYFAAALFQGLLALALPNFLHRVWCTFTACVALQLGCAALGAYGLPTALAAAGTLLVWLNELSLVRQRAFWLPIGYGFALALLHLDSSLIWGHELNQLLLSSGTPHPLRLLFWVGPAAVSVLFLFAAARLLDQAGVDPSSGTYRGLLGIAGLLALFGLAAPGICASLLVLLLGFAAASRTLMGLGILACGGYLAHFYYQLDLSLLTKSLVLLGSGALLLGARLGLGRLWSAEGNGHA
jgi:hypothetical protein